MTLRIGGITFPPGAGLAPMAGVTDANMRLLCAEYGCAWSVSEMLSAKGYLYSPDNRQTRELLMRDDGEGICGLQLFGREPEALTAAARALRGLPFAFFDFNMGCPAHKIVSNGEGSALMREPALAARLIAALIAGAGEKPVTVKIRAGWDAAYVNAVEIAKIAEENGASAVAVHARTRDQMYSGRADRDVIRAVKAAVRIPVIGNGDIACAEDAARMQAETGCDGVLIGRAALGNPFVFQEIQCALRGQAYTPPTARDKVLLALRHLDMQIEKRGEVYAIPEMRKHICWYLSGERGASQVRRRILSMKTRGEVRDALYEYLYTIERRMEHGEV